MAILLTNGIYYVNHNNVGGVAKTHNIDEAQNFYSIERAEHQLQKAPGKCRGYYYIDTESESYKHRKKYIKQKKKRKIYSKTVRKMIYDKSDGRCMLCGRKILFSDMTLDHIMPLAMGGADSVENLQTAHLYCNHFKADILPDEFVERITEIFLYQMGKKYGNELKWDLIQVLMNAANNG